MREPFKLPFSHPVVRRIVCAGFPGAKSRREVKIECHDKMRISDYWDGGSRDYSAFVRLSDMSSLSSEAIPREARQQVANPFHLPIADVIITPNVCIVEHTIFCGKDMGYRIYMNAADIPHHLPEAISLLPVPELPDHGDMPELPEKF